SQVNSLAEKTEKLGKSSPDLDSLKRERDLKKDRLSRYENDLADLEAELRPNVPARVTRFQEATVLKRDQKRQILATAAAPVGLLLLTCFGVAWWECRARRIHTADEVSTGLGMRVIGAVPALSRAAQRVVAGTDEDIHEQHLLESIDGIRTM